MQEKKPRKSPCRRQIFTGHYEKPESHRADYKFSPGIVKTPKVTGQMTISEIQPLFLQKLLIQNHQICKFQEFVHTKHENLKIANIATIFSVQKLENGLKVIRYLLIKIL